MNDGWKHPTRPAKLRTKITVTNPYLDGVVPPGHEVWTITVTEQPTHFRPVYLVRAELDRIEHPDLWDVDRGQWLPAHVSEVPGVKLEGRTCTTLGEARRDALTRDCILGRSMAPSGQREDF